MKQTSGVYLRIAHFCNTSSAYGMQVNVQMLALISSPQLDVNNNEVHPEVRLRSIVDLVPLDPWHKLFNAQRDKINHASPHPQSPGVSLLAA